MKYLNRLKAEKGLLSVPTKPTKAPFVSNVSAEERRFSENIPLPLPFFEADGNLVIPFGSDPHYRWWQGGQFPSETERELKSWVH